MVSEHFGNILTKMLKVTPRDRYQSPNEVLRALELEPYLDNLMYCMNVNPKPFPRDEGGDEYVPPMVRTAMAIRDWRAKLKARRVRGDRFQPKMTCSSSNRFQ